MSALFSSPEYESFMEKFGNSVELVNNQASPRFIKSHLPFELLPRQLKTIKPKVIYIARNPKDVCVSYYHYCKLLHNLNATFEEFCELFLVGHVPVGLVWSHFFGYWNHREDINLLFLKYEDMKIDLKNVIRKIALYLEKSLTDDQVNTLYEHLSFKNMKNNRAVNLQPLFETNFNKNYIQNSCNNFIRKGEVGDWKNYMSPELSMKFDKWIESNTKGTGLFFN